jgi:hypothetical protein
MKGLITPTNGRTADETPTATVPKTPQGSSKTRIIIASIVAALVIAALAVVAVVLATGNTTTVAKANPVVVYQQTLGNALAPVVAANRAISVSLQALDGSQTTIRATKTATANAQQALIGARGALASITVPAASTQLSQQAAQALTQENGYLQSVNTTLSDPAGNTVASVQPLASAASSAFVPLASVAPGGGASIYGVDNLLSWSQGATAAQRAHTRPTVINNNTTNVVPQTPTVVVPSTEPNSTPSSSTGLCADTVGNNDITVGSNVSCPFAKNVLIAAATYYQSHGHLPDGVSLSVSSPTTGSSYMVAYSVSSSGDAIFATNTESSSSSGNDITFSSSLANGTGPG